MQLRAFMNRSRILCLQHDLGKLLQRTSTPKFLRIVDDDLDVEHALALGIDLQSQPATVQLEHRQIIRGFLDRYFPFG